MELTERKNIGGVAKIRDMKTRPLRRPIGLRFTREIHRLAPPVRQAVKSKLLVIALAEQLECEV